jgi:hypothetical protein
LRGVDANGHAIPITKPELIPPGLELNPAREMAAIGRNGVDPDWTIEGRLATHSGRFTSIQRQAVM